MLVSMLNSRDTEMNKTRKLHKDRHSCLLCSLPYPSRLRTVPGKVFYKYLRKKCKQEGRHEPCLKEHQRKHRYGTNPLQQIGINAIIEV